MRHDGLIVRLAAGLMVGLVIAGVDNFAFEGEVSPIVIVVLLLAATTITMAIWGGKGIWAALAAWLCLPLAHFFKHIFGLPDTLQPNTYVSILALAAFTFGVACVGAGIGVLIHRGVVGRSSNGEKTV